MGKKDVDGHELHTTAKSVEPRETNAHGDAFSFARVFVVVASDDESTHVADNCNLSALGVVAYRISRQRLTFWLPATQNSTRGSLG